MSRTQLKTMQAMTRLKINKICTVTNNWVFSKCLYSARVTQFLSSKCPLHGVQAVVCRVCVFWGDGIDGPGRQFSVGPCGALSTKFGLQIYFDLRMKVTSLHTKPEVVLRYRCQHLQIVYDVITPPLVARFGWNLVAWCGIATPITMIWSRSSNRKKKSNMADVCFSKPEVVISQW